jgi:hypothetical protein
MRKRATAALAALLTAAALGACGGDDEDPGADTTRDTNAPVNTDTPGPAGSPAPQESGRGPDDGQEREPQAR